MRFKKSYELSCCLVLKGRKKEVFELGGGVTG